MNNAPEWLKALILFLVTVACYAAIAFGWLHDTIL